METPKQWSQRVLNHPDEYCILDTETTGLNGAEPIEIGITDLYGRLMLNIRVKPTILIEADAIAIHGITNKAVKDAPSFARIYTDLLKAIGTRKLLIYNASYDLNVLKNACKAWDISYPHFYAECVMLRYSEFVGDWNPRFGNYKWQKLPSGDHTAIGDCRATLAVIQEMALS
jgi:DNA polymerase-3 subunit epsilon